ncbi:MAG: ABC transporter ATP-binding protein [Acidobacteriota bacterium]
MMSVDVLRASQVTKRFSNREVLRGVDLQIPQGSVCGLIGRNGAGKSTLLECAVGLQRISNGELRLLGEDSSSLSPEAQSRLGFVPQTPANAGWMTGRRLLKCAASFYPSWNWRLAERLVEAWGLDLRPRLRTLSEGTARQLAILMALAPEPDVLVLDEPVAGLDPIARRTFLQEILEIALEGDRTVLFSTHITSDLERVADQVAVLIDGAIRFSGYLDILKERVVRLYVRSPEKLPETLGLTGTLREDVEWREATAVVEGLDPREVEALEESLNARVEVKTLSLENIFLELHNAN